MDMTTRQIDTSGPKNLSIVARARILSPLMVFLVVWFVPLAILALGIVQYEGVTFESFGMFYLSVCLCLFVVGFKLGSTKKSYSNLPLLSQTTMRERLNEDIRRFQRPITYFALAGILAAVLFSIEMLFVAKIDPTDLAATREIFGSREVTILSQVATILGAGGFLSLVPVLLSWEQLSRRRRALWLLAPVSLTALSLFSAGRQTVLQLVLIGFFTVLLRGRSTGSRLRRLATTVVFGLTIVIALVYGMTVSSTRSGESVTGAKEQMLSNIFVARLDSNLSAALYDQPAVIRDGAAEFLFYLSHPIPNFLIFFELPRPGPYWGLWELPFVARRLESLGATSISERQRIDQVYNLFAATGRSPSVWQTGFRDFIIDFGDVGALLVTVLFGFLAGRVHYHMRTQGGLIWAYLLVGLDVLCVYSALVSGISDTLIFFYFVVAAFMYLRYARQVCEEAPQSITRMSFKWK